MGEAPRLEARRRVQKIALHRDDAAKETIQRDVVVREVDEIALRLEAGDAAAFDALDRKSVV